MQRLRPLSEAECYARCYGWRADDVKVVVVARTALPLISGEALRSLFEEKLDSREPEAA